MSRWKSTERRLAAMCGGERVPITGRQRGSAPDIAHEWLSIEVKDRKSVPEWLKDAMRQAQASKRGEQLPIVILHEKGMRMTDCMVLVKWGDFLEWFGDDK